MNEIGTPHKHGTKCLNDPFDGPPLGLVGKRPIDPEGDRDLCKRLGSLVGPVDGLIDVDGI